jgi:hypothetical protein
MVGLSLNVFHHNEAVTFPTFCRIKYIPNDCTPFFAPQNGVAHGAKSPTSFLLHLF